MRRLRDGVLSLNLAIGTPLTNYSFALARRQALMLVAGQVAIAGIVALICAASIDLQAGAASALQAYDPSTILQTTDAANPWASGRRLLDAYAKACADSVLGKWRGQLGGADVFTQGHCFKVQESLRAD